MKKQYVSKTLGEFIGESNSITLKRKYTDARPAVVVGVNAPLRNQVLSFVAENASVSKIDLKQFILGLKEGNTSSAAASMFIKRNAHYFITENKNGMTYFKLSNLGQRLVNQFAVTQEINENEEDAIEDDDAMDIEAPETAAEEVDFEEIEDDEESIEDETDNFEYEEDDDKIVLTYYKNPEAHKAEEEAEGEEDFDHNDEEIEDEVEDDDDADFSKYDFKDKGRPGIYDMDESLNETRAKRMRQIIENLKQKNTKSLNEADEADELTDADLDTIDTNDEEGEAPAEGDETATNLDGEGEVEKVEITEFIITVDDVDSAIDELAELGVTAERVPVEKPVEDVPAPEETEEQPAETEEQPAEGEEKSVEATKESLQRFVDDLLNEEEASDELGLGDQGQDATELDQTSGEGEAETDLVEPTQEFEQNKIKVQAADWDTLKGWLEEKGVDVKEMFGGDIEVEEFDTEDEANAAVKGEEISDDEIDFSGIGEDDDTKVEDEKTNESVNENYKGFDKLTYKVVKPLGDDPAMIGGYLIDDFDNEFNPEVGDTFTAERWQGTFEVKYNGNEYYINMEDFSDTVDAGYFEEI